MRAGHAVERLPKRTSIDLHVREVEVVFPIRPVARLLPASRDRLAIVAERSRETLREVRRVSPQLSDVVAQAHLIHTKDAARVEVVLAKCFGRRVRADDRDAIGEVGVCDIPALNKEGAPVSHSKVARPRTARGGSEGTVASMVHSPTSAFRSSSAELGSGGCWCARALVLSSATTVPPFDGIC